MGENKKVRALIKTLQESFDGQPWYGISVMEKLNDIDWRLANEKPLGSSKSVVHLLGHMVNWRIFVWKKMQGDANFDIVTNSEADWPKFEVKKELEWNGFVTELRETQKELILSLSGREDGFLETIVPGRNYNFDHLIKGIVQHDIYHLGQIGLLYGMVKSD